VGNKLVRRSSGARGRFERGPAQREFLSQALIARRKEMSRLLQGIKRFGAEEDGVTMIEYGLLAALIAVVSVVIITSLGTTLRGVFQTVCTALNKNAACAQ
jgi:pilus assembly protein Flp/PilA